VTAKVKRGRPRDPSVDLAIIDAASSLMAERGYRGMTVAGVAAAARVSEPTVYLRYPTKQDLAMAAIARLPILTHPPDTGDAREDLEILLTSVLATTRAIGLSIGATVLAAEAEHPELLEHWRTTVGAALVGVVSEIVQHGRDRGQVRPEIDPGVVADLLLGAYLGRHTHTGPPDDQWVDQVLDALWGGLAAP
jgi:AcrR family transcriptional regulator